MKSLFVLLLALLAGCQSYRPAPIDAAGALASWRSRALASIGAESASAPGPQTGLSLARAEAIALTLNPSLRKARLEAEGARRGAEEAGRGDDPSIEFNVERVLAGVDEPWVIGGLVNLSIPLSGRLRIERQLAASDADVARLRVLLLERLTIADLRRAWMQWSAELARLEVLDGVVADLKSFESTTTRLRDAGEIDPTEARLFSIDLVRRRAERLSTRRDAARLEAHLRELMGLTPDAPLKFAPGRLPARPETEAPRESNPRVALAAAAYASAERALELEIRKQYPDLQLGGGLGTEDGDARLLGGVMIPVPVLNANRRAIAEARARREVARAEFEAELMNLEHARSSSRNDLLAAREVLDAIETDLSPLVDRQLADARKLLEAGESSPLLIREAIDVATEARLQRIEAQLSLNEAIVGDRLLNEAPFATPKETR